MTVISLSNELADLCADVLVDCQEFESYDRLRNFVAPRGKLNAIYDRLSKADTPPDLVTSNLPLLLEERSADLPVLLDLIDALKLQYPAEGLKRGRLNDLYQSIHRYLTHEGELSEEEKKKKLFTQIIGLDFEEQSERFDPANLDQVAAFVIKGQAEGGQQVFMKRLETTQGVMLEDWGRWKWVPTDVNNGVGANIDLLWKRVGRRFLNGNGAADPESILDAICQAWQSQSVVLVFYGVDYMVAKSPNEQDTWLACWLRDFWSRLVSRALAQPLC